MVKYRLEIQAKLQNVIEVFVDPDPSTRWYVKLVCSACGYIHGRSEDKIVYFDGHLHPTSTKGNANYVAKCENCKREITISIIPNTFKSYLRNDSEEEDEGEVDPTFSPIIDFEIRGAMPLKYEFRAGWCAKAKNSNLIFTDLEFTDLTSTGVDWCDFDAVSNVPVGVYDLKSEFTTFK